jgi:hypothetical protein
LPLPVLPHCSERGPLLVSASEGHPAGSAVLQEGYLADRSEAIDPIKYHWFTRYVFGRAVRAARLDWTRMTAPPGAGRVSE